MKKRGPAMTVIEGLLARSTRPPEIYRSMATALARWQEDDLALRVSEAWRTDVPTSAEAHFWCAIFLARTQHSPAVVLRELRQASRLDPDNISYRAQLAIALASIGRADQASDLLVRLDVGQVACPHLATRIARTFESAGQPNKALAWWTRSLNLTARGQSLAHEKRIGLEADPSEDPASGS
jgi:thioredoxin-like negative regulator of GroEL